MEKSRENKWEGPGDDGGDAELRSSWRARRGDAARVERSQGGGRLGPGADQEAARGGAGAPRTHPVQEAQAVPQRHRGRHGAGQLPAPPSSRQARAPSNNCAGPTPLANHSREAGPAADFGKQFAREPIQSPRTKTDKTASQLQGSGTPGAVPGKRRRRGLKPGQ